MPPVTIEEVEVGWESEPESIQVDWDSPVAVAESPSTYVLTRVRVEGDTPKNAVKNFMKKLDEIGIDHNKCYEIVLEEHASKGLWMATGRLSMSLESFMGE